MVLGLGVKRRGVFKESSSHNGSVFVGRVRIFMIPLKILIPVMLYHFQHI